MFLHLLPSELSYFFGVLIVRLAREAMPSKSNQEQDLKNWPVHRRRKEL